MTLTNTANWRARAGLACLVALLCVPSRAWAEGEGETETFQQAVLALGPATDKGAPATAKLFRERLMAPPGAVDPGARAFCGRYLPVVRRALDAKKGSSCEAMVDVLQAQAMCRWFSGADEEAGGLLREVGRMRCAAENIDGLSRAIDLAERWLWTEPVRALVDAQAEGPETLPNRARIDAIDNRRAMAIAAFGGNGWGRGLLVVARSAMGPAGRASLDVGDVILNVDAQPVWSLEAMKVLLGDGSRRHPFVSMRAGRRSEGSWMGLVEGVTFLPLPERTAGR
ncbi:MAG: PDZ domain-containing protein [Myxococcota bacterium]